jgi:hypothetical protein
MQALLFFGAATSLLGGASLIAFRRFGSLPEAQAADVKKLHDLIDKNKVVVLSKTYCPYCARTKQLLVDELRANCSVIELDTRADGDALQSAA